MEQRREREQVDRMSERLTSVQDSSWMTAIRVHEQRAALLAGQRFLRKEFGPRPRDK